LVKYVHSLFVVGLWLGVAAAGGWWLHAYESAPGPAQVTSGSWPSDTSLAQDKDRPNLVIFAHPQCPCTRATIEELNHLLARCAGTLACTVVFLQPSSAPSEWVKSGLWKSAAAIPGVTVAADPNGAEAHRFGAETSGLALLYDRQGKLVFHGGITATRGHAGDNLGVDTILSLVRGEKAPTSQTPVFGCSLLDGCTAAAK
jgi:hypothetical protein